MARQLRIEYPGAVYHVTARGNAQKEIFFDDTDRHLFLDVLGSTVEKYNWLCHAYCLMENHYHLLIETPDPNLSLRMRQLNGVYTQQFGRKKRKLVNCIENLWMKGYKEIVKGLGLNSSVKLSWAENVLSRKFEN